MIDVPVSSVFHFNRRLLIMFVIHRSNGGFKRVALTFSVLLPRFNHQGTSSSRAINGDEELRWIYDGTHKTNPNIPCFQIEPNQVQVLLKPNEFYEKLKELSEKSQRRITISSLYIGSGHREKELVDILAKKIKENPELCVTILLDYCRGNRLDDKANPKSSSKGLLEPLISKNTLISFYLSPYFSSWLRKNFIFPHQRWNEIISLQHIKCYLFDDNLIMSGANLSDHYFTHRQDRYICIYNCKDLCNYFDELIKVVSNFSLQLTLDGHLETSANWPYHPLDQATRNLFINEANKSIRALQEKYSNFNLTNSSKKTFVIPLLQMRTFNVNDDEKVISQLLMNVPSNSTVKLASGYFNLTANYIKLFLNLSSKTCDILMASETANGFYNGKGLSKYIPSFYTEVAKLFLRQNQRNQTHVQLWSYARKNWTFHAKGLWIWFNPNYVLTTIGSPNFGYRSVYKDLEAQLILVTNENQLKSKLIEEERNLWEHSEVVNTEQELPSVPLWAQIVSRFVKRFF